MLVSHSSLATFLTCPRKWKYVYIDRRVPRETARALEIGRIVDEATASGKLDVEDPALRALLKGWDVRWRGSTLRVIETHVPFTFQFGEHEIVGELDAIAEDQNGTRVVIERKTTSNEIAPGSQYWKRVLNIDPQVSTYLQACRDRGISQVIWDVLRKPALRQKKDESPAEFHHRVLEDIASRPDHYYQRATVVRLEVDRADFVADVNGTIRLMQVGVYPRNPGSCFMYRQCEYFDACAGNVRLDNDDIFMDRSRPARDATQRT